jgi:hypothetical protein
MIQNLTVEVNMPLEKELRVIFPKSDRTAVLTESMSEVFILKKFQYSAAEIFYISGLGQITGDAMADGIRYASRIE